MVNAKLTTLAIAALDATAGLAQGAAKDRTVQAFFAGALAADPNAIGPSDIMAVAMSGATVVERWAGREPQPGGEQGPRDGYGRHGPEQRQGH